MNGNDVLDSSLIYLSIISSSEFYHTILSCNEFLIIFSSKTLCARFVFVSSFVSRAFIAYFLYFLSLPPTHFNGILSFYPHTHTDTHRHRFDPCRFVEVLKHLNKELPE